MKTFIFLSILILSSTLFSQQVPDTTYNPDIQNPVYGLGEGSVVFIDGGHHNAHTKNGGFTAFSNLLERDGYNVQEYSGEFEKNELAKGKILVIANAINEINVDKWHLPNPSAFTKSEIKTVKNWVKKGGSLFLIADHMPFPGAAEDLAKAFGFEFTNGFVVDTVGKGNLQAYFSLNDHTLASSTITKGRDSSESVNQIVTFTGQGFHIPDDANPILTFDSTRYNVLPDAAWAFNKNSKYYNAAGMSQGAYKKFGKGRIVVFGEAAMFTAQLQGPKKSKMGMSNEAAPENHQLLLNIIHWLDGKLE